MSENGKAEEKYTVTIKLEDYVQVPVAEYVNDAADLIKGSGKFEVKVDENKNVKVTVNNTSANDPIIGGTQVIFALTEMFNEGTIASMTLTIDGYDDADPLTINKDDNYFDVIKTYLETYLKTKKPSLTIETAKLQDIIGTKFSVKVKLTEDAKVKGSDDKLDEETYNVEIRKQPEQKNVASMVDSVKKVLEGTHDEGKYTVKVEGNKVDVKVKAENREDKVIGGTDIIVALGKLLNEDNKVDHITLNYCGCDIEIKNAATAKNEIIAWVIENKDKMFKAGTFDSLTAETITNLTNEKVYGMLKDTAAAATITVALKEDFVSENKNEQETYTITFELEDYTIVKEQEVISNLTSKLETAGKFVAIVDEENPQNVTVAVKADFINESVLSTGTGVILALTEMFNNNVASLTLTYNGADVEQTLEIKKDTNYVETITQWLNRNQLNDLKNSQFAGKTITVKATLTPDARTEAGEKETKEYTITIKLLADIRAMQENAIGKKEGINDPTKGKVQVNIEENIVKVKMLSPTTKLSELTSHTGANVTLTEFMNTPGIKSFTIIVGETKTDEPSPNYVTVEKSSDYTPYAAQLAFKLMSSVPDPSVASEQDLVDMKTTIKVQIELDDDYVLAPDSYLEYTLDFVV